MASKGTLFIIIVSALALGGCASATLTAGVNLSKVGQTTATQMEQNATVSSAAMLSFRKAVAFEDAYNNQIGTSTQLLTHIDAIQNAISQYAKMLDSLASTYSALGDLASYDAVGSFNTSFATFDKDANNFLHSVQPSSQIRQETASAVQAGVGIAIGLIQAHEVKNASRTIKTKLQIIIPIMDDPQTKKLLVFNKQETTKDIEQAAETLFDNGVYSYGPLLDDLGAALNLKSNSQSDAIVANNANLLRGLRYVAIELANEQSDQMEGSYDKSVAALKALVPLHESLEKGAPLNLDTALAITNQLRTIATSLQPARSVSMKMRHFQQIFSVPPHHSQAMVC
jgi:hypothetical protein